MKKFIAAGLMLASVSAFSQSYLILNNGITLTTDKSGFLYDFGHFLLPNQVTVNGGQFLVADDKLSTVDEKGFFYDKDLKLKKIKGKGLNYLINNDNDLVTVDTKGFYYKFEDKAFKKVISFGGNYFLVKPEDKKPQVDLYTVNSSGNFTKIAVPGLDPADINVFGGKYFQTRAGVTYTVSKDGFVFSKSNVKAKAIRKAGGNFFIDADNFLYTVSDDGLLVLPILPLNIRVATITKIGANYLLDSEGKAFVVDKSGVIFERKVNHDLRNTKILSL